MSWDVQNVHNTAVKAVQRGALSPNPRSVQAFQDAFSGDAAQKAGIGANEEMVLAQLVARGPLPCTTENIQALIGELWDQLADNPQAQRDQAASDRRARQIAEMTENGTKGFSIQRGPRKYAYGKDGRPHDHNKGMSQGSSMALHGAWSAGAGKSFDEMSDEEVAQLYDEWRTTNELRGKSVEELRAIVKSNGATDLFGKNVRPPSAPAPDGGEILLNPATGAEFTQRELIRYINAAPMNGRNLLVNPNTGKMIPWKKERFDKIIRGELS